MELERSAFEQIVSDAVKRLPRRFRQTLKNIAIVVEDWPDQATLDEMEIEPPDTLFGLYRGVDLTHRDSSYMNVLPDTITIYQGPIEEECESLDEMSDLVRDVVAHEIGHYFGLDDSRLEEIEEEGRAE